MKSPKLAWVGFALLLALLLPAAAGAAETPSCSSSAMYVVAHQDDTLLFQSPALLQDIQAGKCVRTVFLSAGDDGQPQSYWGTREQGAEAAYAQLAGVGNTWTASTLTANGHALQLATLAAQPKVSIVFMRLPDGGYPAGLGNPVYGNQSLMQLWNSGNGATPAKSSITAVDGSNTYGYQDLISTLAALMTSYQPQAIRTQNYLGSFNVEDHNDHVAAAYFTRAAQKQYPAAHELIGYEDYEDEYRPANLSGSLLETKRSAFYRYSGYDVNGCASAAACAGSPYAAWLTRQYVAGSETIQPAVEPPTAVAGQAQSVASGAAVTLDGSASSDPAHLPLTYQWAQTAGPSVTLSSATAAKPTFTAPTGPATLTFSLVVSNGSKSSAPASVSVTVAAAAPVESNVAPLATATASSQASAYGQTAGKAIDGVIDGYPGNYEAEWATEGGKSGSTLTLKWSKSYSLDKVVLFDRPNASDQITAGKLTFSDGTSVSFASLPNAGSPGLTVSFPAHATSSLQMTVTGVSASTVNVGLAEIQAFGLPVEGGTAPSSAPVFTSPSSGTGVVGKALSIGFEATGTPTPTLSLSGSAPSGLKFTAASGGKATLSGTPTAAKTSTLTIVAKNSIGTTKQNFTLVVSSK